MNSTLENATIEQLTAALQAKQQAAMNASQQRDQSAMRAHDARVRATKELAQRSRRAQDPVKWAQEMADAGLPVAAAKVQAEVLSVIFERLTALEASR